MTFGYFKKDHIIIFHHILSYFINREYRVGPFAHLPVEISEKLYGTLDRLDSWHKSGPTLMVEYTW